MLKAVLIGNIGGEPEMRYAQDGSSLLRFSVASNGRTKLQNGEWVDRTEWVQVTVFGNRAEAISQYLHKGMKVYVDGRLEARPWTDQQGQVRAGLSITAAEVQFVTPRSDEDGEYERRPVASGQRQQQQRDTRQELGLDEDDIPF